MRKIFTSFFILIFLLGFSQDSIIPVVADTIILDVAIDTPIFNKFDDIIETARMYKGVKYRYGGMDFNGMDCSGLVCTAYKDYFESIPRTSSQLAKVGTKVEADYLEKGDLIFFKGRTSSSVAHVAIVSKVEDGLIYIVHATSSRGVMEEVLQKNSYFMKRWLFNRRVE